jgi:Na+/melibiose symporter-like transporter
LETRTPVAAAGTPTGHGISRVRHLGLGAYWFGTYFVITPVYTILLQVQVTSSVAKDLQGSAIGLATGLGGLFAMVLPPIVGAWSDHLTTRWGRRRPIMLAGTLGIVAALLVCSPPTRTRRSSSASCCWSRSSTSRARRMWR